MASVWADYTIPIGLLKRLGFGGGVRYIGSNFGDVPNTIKVPDVTLVDATIHCDWRKLRLAVNASNVFDEEYVATCFVRGDAFCTFGPTRKVTGSVNFRW